LSRNLASSSARIAVPEIAGRLSIGRLAVYALLERGVIPGVRLNRRWIVTRYAYEQWERTCGSRPCFTDGPSLAVACAEERIQ
jgi:hypothetical protein